MRLVMLDVGSNAARLELVDLDRPRMPRVTWSFKARTHLAEHTDADGVVSAAGIEHAVAAVRACVRAAGDRIRPPIIAFGTSAVRDARNGALLRERLSVAAGVPLGVLSPYREASLTYHAARRWHGSHGTRLTTVDIGGGTLDVATGRGAFPSDVVSLPLGAARLTRLHLPDDPPSPSQVEALGAELRATIGSALRRFSQVELGHAVAQSTVLRQLAVLASSSGSRPVRHPDSLVRGSLRRWIPRLAAMKQKQRAKLPGVSRARARRILAGAILAEVILETIDVDRLEICPWGIREGLAFRFVDVHERDDAIPSAVEDMFA